MFLIKKKLAHLFSVGKSLQFKRNKPLRDVLSCIPDQSSTFTAETCAELLAVEYIGNADERKFTVCADSESYLQARFSPKQTRDEDTTATCRIPGRGGIRGNERADTAASQEESETAESRLRTPNL